MRRKAVDFPEEGKSTADIPSRDAARNIEI